MREMPKECREDESKCFSSATPLLQETWSTPAKGTPIEGTPIEGTPIEGTLIEGPPFKGTPVDTQHDLEVRIEDTKYMSMKWFSQPVKSIEAPYPAIRAYPFEIDLSINAVAQPFWIRDEKSSRLIKKLAALPIDFSELAFGTKCLWLMCVSEAIRQSGKRDWILFVVRQGYKYEWTTAPDDWPRRAPERRTETIRNRVWHSLAVVSLQAAPLFQKTKGNITMLSLYILGGAVSK